MFKALKELQTMMQRVYSNRSSLLIKTEERLLFRCKNRVTDKQPRETWKRQVTVCWSLAEGHLYNGAALPTMYHPWLISFQKIQHLLESITTEKWQGAFSANSSPVSAWTRIQIKRESKLAKRKTERERWRESECKGHLVGPQGKSKIMREEATGRGCSQTN